jgi:hypothetical protein
MNKPTYFQSDWGTTISNKQASFPADMTNFYTKTEVKNMSRLANLYDLKLQCQI